MQFRVLHRQIESQELAQLRAPALEVFTVPTPLWGDVKMETYRDPTWTARDIRVRAYVRGVLQPLGFPWVVADTRTPGRVRYLRDCASRRAIVSAIDARGVR